MKSTLFTLFWASFFLFFGLMGCAREPEGLLDESTYIDVMTELAFVNELEDALLEERGITRAAMMDSVYVTYEVTPNEFLISHNYYQRDAHKHSERIEKVEQRIQAERERIQKHVRELEKQAARRDSAASETTRPKRPDVLPNVMSTPESDASSSNPAP